MSSTRPFTAILDHSAPGRALIVADSMFGNTRHVAKQVATGLRTAGWSVDVVDVASAPSPLPSGLDLLVVGSSTHGFSLHRPLSREVADLPVATAERERFSLLTWLAEVQPGGSTWPSLAVYDTHVANRKGLPQSIARRAFDVALERGFTAMRRPATFLVLDDRGPLAPGEIERADQWGRSLAASPDQVPPVPGFRRRRAPG